MVQLLASQDVGVASFALQAMATSGRAVHLERVRDLAKSMQVEVRRNALLTLGALGDKASVAMLEKSALSDGNPQVCAAAGEALEKLGKADGVTRGALAALSAKDGNLGSALAVLTAARASASLTPLIELLQTQGMEARPGRIAAAFALGKQALASKQAQKVLLQCLGESDAGVKAACAEAFTGAALDGLKNRLAYWKLVPMLKHPDERVRSAAIAAAAALEPARFAKELAGLRAGGSRQVLLTLARVLGRVPGKLALQRLLDLSAADDPEIRSAAATSLHLRAEPGARARLEELRADAAASVREATIGALSSPEALESALGDPEISVRARALGQLVRSRGRKAALPQALALFAEADSEAELVHLLRAWLVKP
jgi:HEAT repeat protein